MKTLVMTDIRFFFSQQALFNRLNKRLKLLLLASVLSSDVLATEEYTIDLYETYCISCHANAGAGVPVAFNEQDWEKRLKTGMDNVVNNAIKGVGNMPAQGFCMECTYEDFEDLVSYMSKARAE